MPRLFNAAHFSVDERFHKPNTAVLLGFFRSRLFGRGFCGLSIFIRFGDDIALLVYRVDNIIRNSVNSSGNAGTAFIAENVAFRVNICIIFGFKIVYDLLYSILAVGVGVSALLADTVVIFENILDNGIAVTVIVIPDNDQFNASVFRLSLGSAVIGYWCVLRIAFRLKFF